jgi:hypothetical protein
MHKNFFKIIVSYTIIINHVSAQWIEVPKDLCVQQGGTITNNTICETSWKNAQDICNVIGGQLPSQEELRKLILTCNGSINNSYDNKNNEIYQECYTNKGFLGIGNYWGMILDNVEGQAWAINFKNGTLHEYNTLNEYKVKCTKSSNLTKLR